MPGDGFPLQRPVEVCQESWLNAKAGLGRSGHLKGSRPRWLRNLRLRQPSAVVPLGACGWRGLFHGWF